MNTSSGNQNDCNDLHGTPPSIDEILKILEHPLRRGVIDCCSSIPSSVITVGDVADQVMSSHRESGEPVDRARLLAKLHHRHLPVLAEHGVVAYDPRGGQLRYRPNERLERWLRRIQADESG